MKMDEVISEAMRPLKQERDRLLTALADCEQRAKALKQDISYINSIINAANRKAKATNKPIKRPEQGVGNGIKEAVLVAVTNHAVHLEAYEGHPGTFTKPMLKQLKIPNLTPSGVERGIEALYREGVLRRAGQLKGRGTPATVYALHDNGDV